MVKAAVIFDVDGPLLDLTADEENAFFQPFKKRYGLTDLSYDWDSYRIRNDVEIYSEIIERHLGKTPTTDEVMDLAEDYFEELRTGYENRTLNVVPIAGALNLLKRLNGIDNLALGTATANFRNAAQQRLERVGMWPFLSAYPGAADGGGAKSEILARVIDDLNLEPNKIAFLGDNLNDLEAGRVNNVHFIGFHVEQSRRDRLIAAGAKTVTGDHQETWALLKEMLDLE